MKYTQGVNFEGMTNDELLDNFLKMSSTPEDLERAKDIILNRMEEPTRAELDFSQLTYLKRAMEKHIKNLSRHTGEELSIILVDMHEINQDIIKLEKRIQEVPPNEPPTPEEEYKELWRHAQLLYDVPKTLERLNRMTQIARDVQGGMF